MPSTSRKRSGVVLDDIEDLVAERLNEPFGIDGADAADHAGGEVFLHALDRGRLRGLQELRPELQPMRAVILPGPARRHPFAGRDRRRMAKGGDEILLAAHFHAEHAKAVLLVVEGHPLHKAGENFKIILDRHVRLCSWVPLLKVAATGFDRWREVSRPLPFRVPANRRSMVEASFSSWLRRTGRDRLAAAAILLSVRRNGQRDR